MPDQYGNLSPREREMEYYRRLYGNYSPERNSPPIPGAPSPGVIAGTAYGQILADANPSLGGGSKPAVPGTYTWDGKKLIPSAPQAGRYKWDGQKLVPIDGGPAIDIPNDVPVTTMPPAAGLPGITSGITPGTSAGMSSLRGMPSYAPGAPAGAAPAGAPPGGDLQSLLYQANIDNLTNSSPPLPQVQDFSGLEAAAANLQQSPADGLSRFGFAMAAGESPHFGVNAGNAGLNMLDNKDQGYARYITARQNIAQLQATDRQLLETGRSNRADERTRAIATATPPASATRDNPAVGSMFKNQETWFLEEYKRITDTESMDPRYTDPDQGPANRQEDLLAHQAAMNNFYESWGVPMPPLGDLITDYTTS